MSLAQTHPHDPRRAARLPRRGAGYQLPIGAGGVQVHRALLRLCSSRSRAQSTRGLRGLTSTVDVGGSWRQAAGFAQVSVPSRRAVFQLARASSGSGAPGAAAPTSASPRPACGGARCSRSPGTAARPARPWKREPAAWTTRRPGARTAGTPSVLGVSRWRPLLSVRTASGESSVRGGGVGWAGPPRVDRKLRKCLIKEWVPAASGRPSSTPSVVGVF